MPDSASAAASAPNVIHVVPVDARYWTAKLVSSVDSSVQERDTLVELAGVARRPEGAAGGIVRDAAELGAEPWRFLADTRNS